MYPVFRDSYEVRNFLAFDEELERFYPMGFEGGVEGGIYVKLLQVRGLEGLNYCSVEMNMAKPLVKKEGGEVVKRPSPVKGKTTTNMKWNQVGFFFFYSGFLEEVVCITLISHLTNAGIRLFCERSTGSSSNAFL